MIFKFAPVEAPLELLGCKIINNQWFKFAPVKDICDDIGVGLHLTPRLQNWHPWGKWRFQIATKIIPIAAPLRVNLSTTAGLNRMYICFHPYGHHYISKGANKHSRIQILTRYRNVKMERIGLAVCKCTLGVYPCLHPRRNLTSHRVQIST